MEKASSVPRNESELMRFAAKWYYSQWRNNQNSAATYEWLRINYNISMDTITKLGLGFHDKEFHSLEQTVSSFGMNDEAERLSLIAKSPKGNYYDKMRNSIIIPTISEKGEVISFDYYLLNEKQLYHYPNSELFHRKEHLYSLNLAIKTKMNHVFVVASFEDYLLLVSHGIWNVVSTYFPRITDEQLVKLKKHFFVILPLVDAKVNYNNANAFARKHNMYSESVDLGGHETVKAFLYDNGYERVKEISRRFSEINFEK